MSGWTGVAQARCGNSTGVWLRATLKITAQPSLITSSLRDADDATGGWEASEGEELDAPTISQSYRVPYITHYEPCQDSLDSKIRNPTSPSEGRVAADMTTPTLLSARRSEAHIHLQH